MNVRPFACVRQPFAKTCTSSRSDVPDDVSHSVAEMPQERHVLEVATSFLHGKYGVEIRFWSLNRHNTHSWVRISHGLNKFVMNLNNNEQEIPEVQLEEMR